jgi:hypothetical protein
VGYYGVCPVTEQTYNSLECPEILGFQRKPAPPAGHRLPMFSRVTLFFTRVRIGLYFSDTKVFSGKKIFLSYTQGKNFYMLYNISENQQVIGTGNSDLDI